MSEATTTRAEAEAPARSEDEERAEHAGTLDVQPTPRASTFASRAATWLRTHAVDWVLVLVLAGAYLGWLLSTVHDLGYARDEGFYFQAADRYLKWFEQLAEDPSGAIKQSSVDRYWTVNHEHPALIKSLFALAHWLTYDRWRLFDEPGTSYRVVGMLLSCMAVALTYLWARRALASYGVLVSRAAGVVAAGGLALMPRVFYHAHLDCFDMPVAAMWLLTTYVYWLSLSKKGIAWPLLTGVLYGLLLNTKHNSWLLPFALVAHLLFVRGFELLGALRTRRFGEALRLIPTSLWFMASVGPLVFYATWPWIWFDTFERLRQYVIFHTRHVYYNMEFLGQTYFEPPFPRSYAPLMTLATVPAVTLALGCAGFGMALLAVGKRCAPRWSALRNRQWSAALAPAAHDDDAADLAGKDLDTKALWALCILVSYAPWLSSGSPIFGGTKHWITAYPFLTMFGAVAFVKVVRSARDALSNSAARPLTRGPIIELLLCASVLIAPFAITAHSHPWGLSAYTPVVGGSPGAATLGLNRSFWGYTTGAVQDEINELAKRRAKVFVHDTAIASWRMMSRDKRLRKDLRPQLSPAGSHLGVYHHEQHMSRVEHQIWIDYGTVKPSFVAGPDGVPVVWLYERPSKSKSSDDTAKPKTRAKAKARAEAKANANDGDAGDSSD